ncbi:hypothetical protein FACS189428_7150 [Clostridia bacterium]|nr:hypothetical protein FACS189428_7150 [Clostridia bacterium]
MKYCKETTLNHHLAKTYPSAVELLIEIFSNNGNKKMSFSDDEQALNLDKIEKMRCKGKSSPDNTMDLAMGISNLGKNKQMILVELKLDLNPKNFERKEMDGKINHSIELLKHDPPVCKDKVVIFKKDRIQQAKHYISVAYGKKLKLPIKVMSEQAFKTEYF